MKVVSEILTCNQRNPIFPALIFQDSTPSTCILSARKSQLDFFPATIKNGSAVAAKNIAKFYANVNTFAKSVFCIRARNEMYSFFVIGFGCLFFLSIDVTQGGSCFTTLIAQGFFISTMYQVSRRLL